MLKNNMVIIQGTKQKEETYGKIVAAWDGAKSGQTITVHQPNDMGGKSLEKTLLQIFPDATSESKNKARYITLTKTDYLTELTQEILNEWRTYNKLHYVDSIGFYSMPGIFGWNKIDKGSEILTKTLPDLSGIIADFGCGYGYLTDFLLKQNSKVKTLYAFDIDPKAIEACTKNVLDSRVIIRQADCSKNIPDLPACNAIVMNPPFHDGSKQDHDLGRNFIKTASYHLKKSGHLYMVANAHLPDEKIVNQEFDKVEKLYE
jgi:16S rRNA (guanine1207-N2)-methyltransferase